MSCAILCMFPVRNMESRTEADINLNEIPIRALKPSSRNILSGYLDTIKCIQSKNGLFRDWRGLFQLSGLGNRFPTYMYNLQPHGTKQFLDIWQAVAERSVQTLQQPQLENYATFEQLMRFISEIDRLDCLEDINEFFSKYLFILFIYFIISTPQKATSLILTLGASRLDGIR